MSAQINLYDPRFLRQRDPLTLRNVALASLALYAVLAAIGGWAWQDAATRRDAATAAEAQLKSAQEQVVAATKAAATRRPSQQLVAELENAESLLRRRTDIALMLESGAIGSTSGFSDYLRGFARQAPEGLWLTAFTIGAGGNDMEIRGSMLSPGALPDYIRRLGAEKAFQGRNFAALTMNRADPTPAIRPVGQLAGIPPVVPAPAAAATPAVAPRPVDFVLLPRLADARETRP